MSQVPVLKRDLEQALLNETRKPALSYHEPPGIAMRTTFGGISICLPRISIFSISATIFRNLALSLDFLLG